MVPLPALVQVVIESWMLVEELEECRCSSFWYIKRWNMLEVD